jgi:hypothetical protein
MVTAGFQERPMRAVFLILIVVVVALIAAVLTGMVKLPMTQPAVAPSVTVENGKVITRPGQTPAFDVQTGSIGVGTGKTVAVPKVEIQPSDTRIAVPSVELRRPGTAPAPAPAPAPAAPVQGNSAQ